MRKRRRQNAGRMQQSIRASNAVADGAKDPDLVSFVGFEWTQVGQTPDGHYGHKNVIFRDLEDTKIAKRPIASGGVTVRAAHARQRFCAAGASGFGLQQSKGNISIFAAFCKMPLIQRCATLKRR